MPAALEQCGVLVVYVVLLLSQLPHSKLTAALLRKTALTATLGIYVCMPCTLSYAMHTVVMSPLTGDASPAALAGLYMHLAAVQHQSQRSEGPLAYALLTAVLLLHSCHQVAGLPPVTKDWFEARKAQLSTAAAAPHTKIWYDPLTKKKFQTQQTYQVRLLAVWLDVALWLDGCIRVSAGFPWGVGRALGGWRGRGG